MSDYTELNGRMPAKNIFTLTLTALIWGTAFVAQRTGGDVIGPYSFCCIRSFMGALVLLPVIRLLDYWKLTKHKPETSTDRKMLLLGGILCGICLAVASLFQQLGMYYGTNAGKAGFLTACYIILVPIVGIFLGKKCGWNVWGAVGITLCGLYLLCMSGEFTLQGSDLLVLICSLIYSFHILLVDHFVVKVDAVRMSCIQFVTAGIITIPLMVWLDMGLSMDGYYAWLSSFRSLDAWIPLLYAGVMSSGVAYTLQMVGQQGVNPTVASLLLSLESVFSVLAGWLILGEHLSIRELFGCGLIFAAIVLAQVPMKKRTHNVDME